MLALAGAEDVLLAYQPIGPKANRLAALVQKYSQTQFSCLIDNPKAAAAMANVFSSAGLTVPVYLDIDLGMGRTGIDAGEGAIGLFKFALETPGIRPVGLHAYDGHIRDTDITLRTQKCNTAFLAITVLQRSIAKIPGIPAPVVIAGGSPTFPVHCLRPDVQCSPGTFIYWDKGYSESCPEQGFSPAALVVTRVISQQGSHITLDLGHKSIAAENPLDRRVHFLNSSLREAMTQRTGSTDPSPLQRDTPRFISQSEEHLVIDAGNGHGYQVGDVLYGVPYHICPTVALYERAYTVEDGQVTGEWRNTARDRVIGL
jgi:D-threonine aldolase